MPAATAILHGGPAVDLLAQPLDDRSFGFPFWTTDDNHVRGYINTRRKSNFIKQYYQITLSLAFYLQIADLFV